jgi:hypothetical protein
MGYFSLGRWVWNTVSEFLPKPKVQQKRRKTLAGHSLGGAVSLVAGAHLASPDVRSCEIPVEVFSFGAPAVYIYDAGQKLLAYKDLREYRFSRVSDIIVCYGNLQDFRDTAIQFLLGNEGEIYRYDGTRDARLIRNFELLRALRDKVLPKHIPAIALPIMKLRDAINGTTALEDDILLDYNTLVHNFPGTTALATRDIISWFKDQHSISRYMYALQLSQ